MKNGLGNKKVMAKNIRHYMMLNGKTRSDMCEDLGIKYTTLTDWLKGNTYPRIDAIEKMANYFGVSKADLVEDPENTIFFSGGINRKIDDELMENIYRNFAKLAADERNRKRILAIIEKVEQMDDKHYDTLDTYIDFLLESQKTKQQKQPKRQNMKGALSNGTV